MRKRELCKRIGGMLLLCILSAWMMLLFVDYSAIIPGFVFVFAAVLQGIFFLIASNHVTFRFHQDGSNQETFSMIACGLCMRNRYRYPFQRMTGRLHITSGYGPSVQEQFSEQIASSSVNQKIMLNLFHLPYGYHTIQMDEIVLWDMLGLFCRRYRGKMVSGEILVFPRRSQNYLLQDALRELSGVQQEHYLSEELTQEDSEITEWKPGDSLKRIHWKLSARTDTMMVRKQEEPARNQWHLYVSLCKGENIRQQLDQGYTLAYALLEQQEFELCWYDLQQAELKKRKVSSQEDIQSAFAELMRSELYDGVQEKLTALFGFGVEYADSTFVFRI